MTKPKPQHPDYLRGKNAGRTARRRGKPQPRLVDRYNQPRSLDWIKGMKQGYYYPLPVGNPPVNDEPKVAITVKIDRRLRDQAIALGINRSQAAELGLKIKIKEARRIQEGAPSE